MSFTPRQISDHHLQLAVFRLLDICVRVQEEMEGFLRTAALEKRDGIEATFTWLRKRGVHICLLSDLNREDTSILLQRLNWTVDEDGTVQQVIADQQYKDNPVLLAQEGAGVTLQRATMTVTDTPRLLGLAHAAHVHFNLAICNGLHSYAELAVCPHHAMLDRMVQLPNFLLEHLPEVAGPRVQRVSLLPRLRLPRNLFT